MLYSQVPHSIQSAHSKQGNTVYSNNSLQQYACAYDPAYKGASATGIVVLASGDEESLLSAVATMGPVSVYVS